MIQASISCCGRLDALAKQFQTDYPELAFDAFLNWLVVNRPRFMGYFGDSNTARQLAQYAWEIAWTQPQAQRPAARLKLSRAEKPR